MAEVDEKGFVEFVVAGDVDGVRAALDASPALASARDWEGASVISRAVYLGRMELAREIASKRSDLDLFEASCIGDVESVARHIDADAANANAVAPDGFTPLGFAAFFGHEELLTLLLARGADANLAASNPMAVAPIHSAAANQEPAKAVSLSRALLEAGAKPNAKQQGGFAPLHEATLNRNLPLIELLVAHGADPQQANDEGQSSIDIARAEGFDDVLERF